MTNRYFLHLVGRGLYNTKQFAEESKKFGINRAFPSNLVKTFSFGDKVLLGQYRKNINEELGEALLFGYFVITGVTFDCKNKKEFIEKLISQLNVSNVTEGNSEIVKRECGSYIQGPTYYVTDSLSSIIIKAQNVAREMYITFKTFLNGTFYRLPYSTLKPIRFCRSGTWVELEKPIDSLQFGQQTVSFVGDYEQRRYKTIGDVNDNKP